MVKEHIIFIAGSLSTASFWMYQEEQFTKNYNIHYITELSKVDIGDIAEAAKDSLPERFSLVGFSMGGYVALELMRIIPEKIKKLVLINTSAKPISRKGLDERERSIWLIKKRKFDVLINKIFKKSFYSVRQYNVFSSFLIEMANEIGADNYINQLNSIINKPNHCEVLRNIQCPSLIMFGKNDCIMPIDGSYHLAENIENSTLVSIDECGHMMPLEKHEEMTRIIYEWL